LNNNIPLLPGKSGSNQLQHFQYLEVDGTLLGMYYTSVWI